MRKSIVDFTEKNCLEMLERIRWKNSVFCHPRESILCKSISILFQYIRHVAK